MEGSMNFNLLWDSFEGLDNERVREEVREIGSGANEVIEITSSDQQEDHGGASSSSRRGQKHRHTRYQIRELEKFFKANSNPGERERLEIGRKLKLDANQVKFWFQNKRTNIKTQADRHNNTLLTQENENLRLEVAAMKEALRNALCTKCGGATLQVDRSIREQNLMIEIGRLREELGRLTSVIGQLPGRPSSSLASPLANPHDIATQRLAAVSLGGANYGGVPPMQTGLQMAGTAQNNLASYGQSLVSAAGSEIGMASGGMINIPPEKTYYLELASSAMDELLKLGQVDAPLWNPNMETGGESLNFNEYERSFPPLLGPKPLGFVSEASRASGLIPFKSLELVEALLDVDRWRDMFASMIGSSATYEVISNGIGGSRNGVLQLMQAEIQLISPTVSPRVVKFLRFSRQLAEGVWAVVDLSVDAGREGLACRRLPSGCILHDFLNGSSKVTWIEHTEYDERPVHHQYRRLLSSGLGFGAHKWICALLRHCNWIIALSSTSVNYQLDQTARTGLIFLARRMTSTFCSGVCLTSGQQWNLVQNSPRIMTRSSVNGLGEPSGTILSAALSVWISSTHRRLFDLLLNQDFRCIWDVLCYVNSTGIIAHFPMNHDDNNPNSISLLSSDNPITVLQETASDITGSLIVYAPLDVATASVLLSNGDTSGAALLPCGICIVPGSGEVGTAGGERGSMVTVGFQMLLHELITMDTINTVNDLVARTVMGMEEIVRSTGQGG